MASALATLLCAASAQATTFVPNRFDDPASGGTNCKPPAPADSCSLRGAVEAAQTGDTIELSAGTYELSRGELTLTHEITIVGAGAPATTIEQTGQARVIDAEAALSMSGVTVTGGDPVGAAGSAGGSGTNVFGGGIEAGGALTLTNVVVTGNRVVAGNGGNGAAGSGSSRGGEGGRGGTAGGAGISGGSPLSLTDVAITNNVAQAGSGGSGGAGGTTSEGGRGGAAGEASGGGIDLGELLSLSATDTLIADNQANSGTGGQGGEGGTASGAPGAGGQGEPSDGGGLYSNSPAALTNVTITGNTASGGAGGSGGAARGAKTGGSGGAGIGGVGGGVALFTEGAGRFASVTIAANATTYGVGGGGGAGSGGGSPGAPGAVLLGGGGDLYLTSATLTVSDSIIASGQGESGRQNCAFGGGGVLTSAGHNLDDSDECISKSAAGDLIGTPAGLSPLADNGGPTDTMALLAGSAAIRAGASPCLSASSEPLTSDQRGLPRGEPCDIGAFEGQAPSVTTAPKVTGLADPGLPVRCAGGVFGGDVPQASTVQWLRDGAPIAGATGVSHTVSRTDAGHALSCRETVTNAFGSVSATSASVTPVLRPVSSPPPRPVVSLKLSPTKVRDRHRETITLTLGGRSATVKFSLRRGVGGVKLGKQCVARSHKHRHGRSCVRLVAVGGAPKTLAAKLGTTKITWTPRHLAPGTYELTATPVGGAAVSISFRVRR